MLELFKVRWILIGCHQVKKSFWKWYRYTHSGFCWCGFPYSQRIWMIIKTIVTYHYSYHPWCEWALILHNYMLGCIVFAFSLLSVSVTLDCDRFCSCYPPVVVEFEKAVCCYCTHTGSLSFTFLTSSASFFPSVTGAESLNRNSFSFSDEKLNSPSVFSHSPNSTLATSPKRELKYMFLFWHI